jgi:hypothetical protein
LATLKARYDADGLKKIGILQEHSKKEIQQKARPAPMTRRRMQLTYAKYAKNLVARQRASEDR